MRFTSSSPVENFRVLKVAVRAWPFRCQPESPASVSSAADSFRWGKVIAPSWLWRVAVGYLWRHYVSPGDGRHRRLRVELRAVSGGRCQALPVRKNARP